MMSRKKLLPAAVAAAALALAPAAQAAEDPTQVTVTSGTLDYTTPYTVDNFPGVTLNGVANTVKSNINDWAVTDNTGSLSGWNVKVSASQFTYDNGTPLDAADDPKLPPGSMSMNTAPTVVAGGGQDSLLAPVASVATAIDGAASPILIGSAALTEGQGLWTFDHANAGGGDMSLTVPSTTKATATGAAYVSTVTTTLASGPS